MRLIPLETRERERNSSLVYNDQESTFHLRKKKKIRRTSSTMIRIHGFNFYISNPSMISVGRYSPLPIELNRTIWNEIDRRNAHVLQSAQTFSKTIDRLPSITSNKNFDFNSYHSYHHRPSSSTSTQINSLQTSSLYHNKQSNLTSINHLNEQNLLFGNSIIKSNKADILNIFDQQFLTGDQCNTYTNKYGVLINEDGPFWPENYRILHPTPRLLTRELTPKEFYLSPSMSSKKTNQY